MPLAVSAATSAPVLVRDAVDRYRTHANVGVLFDELRTLARDADIGELRAAVEPFRDLPEVVIPVYETITGRVPGDAQSLVVLANAYWITGRGPEVVGALADRARAADPGNRGAWHLWALAESDARARMMRWQEVASRFPADQLARAALADNATSVASAEHDPRALDLAIATYESLLAEATVPAHRSALETTLATLRKWVV
jgi:hypothetical protein